MPRNHMLEHFRIQTGLLGAHHIVDTRGLTGQAAIRLRSQDGSWSSAVITLKRSLTDNKADAIAMSPAVSWSADNTGDLIDGGIGAFPYHIFEVTTKASSEAEYVDVWLYIIED